MTLTFSEKPKEKLGKTKNHDFDLYLKKVKIMTLTWQEFFTASLFWTGFKPKKPKFCKSITFKQKMFY
jgi:hypothetical protein